MTVGEASFIVFLIFVAAPVSVSFYYWVQDIEKDVKRLKEKEPK